MDVYNTKEEAIAFIDTLYESGAWSAKTLDELKILIITEFDSGSRIAVDDEYKKLFKNRRRPVDD